MWERLRGLFSTNREGGKWSDFHSRESRVQQYKDELDHWIQGDILVDIPLTWVEPPGEDPITGSRNKSRKISLHRKPVKTPLSIICSQTCDISGAGAGERHPYILVAPLIPKEELGEKVTPAQAKSKNVGYLFPINVPESHSQGTEWFADFRFAFPVSKALLISSEVSRLPVKNSEQQLLEFAEAFALKFRRPANSETLSSVLPATLSEMIKQNKATQPGHFEKIEQVRIFVRSGTRLDPVDVNLLVITHNGKSLTNAEQDLWNGWLRKRKTEFKSFSVKFGATIFEAADAVLAELYRETTPLRVDGLPNTKIYW